MTRHSPHLKGVSGARSVGYPFASLGTCARTHRLERCLVSAASIWEISIKSAFSELEADLNEILAGVEPAGFSHLPVVGGHGAKAVELPQIHKDPFDRLLVARARFEPMIRLTDDAVLGGYGDVGLEQPSCPGSSAGS